VRGDVAQRLQDLLEYDFGAKPCIVVPEAQHAKPAALQVLRARRVASDTVGVLAAIELHDDLRIHADEIGDESPQWNLATKTVAAELTIAQKSPQATLCVGFLAPQ
jgi:hypothetical protein